MGTKEKIIEQLELRREEDLSGERLAEALDISRSAVHKAIKELRRDGYDIEASPNKGYRLALDSDVISREGILLYLKEEYRAPLYVYKVISTTNQKAKELALAGAEDRTIVAANEQTAGRGRMGRSFYSPPDTGLYMSIVLRPRVTAKEGMLITTCASVAVCKALENIFGVEPGIKWVNDIILNGKKICGISTEAATDFESGNLEYVILGIGINVRTEEFPEELVGKAGSVGDSNLTILRNRLAAEIANSLFDELKFLRAEKLARFHGEATVPEGARFIEEYRKRSLVLGKNITVIKGEAESFASAVSIDDRGGLEVKYEDGTKETLISGEISIRGDFYHG